MVEVGDRRRPPVRRGWWLALFLAGALAAPAAADQVHVVDPASLTTVKRLVFDEGDFFDEDGNPRAINIDSVYTAAGAHFGERFLGQQVGTATFHDGQFDVVSGLPTGPLTVTAGPPGKNISLAADTDDFQTWWWAMGGTGPVGFSDDFDTLVRAVGEGSLAIGFDRDQSELAFELRGFDPVADEGTPSSGEAVVSFYRRDGSLIDSLAFPNTTTGTLGFRRDGGTADVAGVLIVNTDYNGVGINDLRFDQDAPNTPSEEAPEPSSLILLGVGLAGAAGVGLRRWVR
jgi:hypothetical protein